MDIVPFNVGAVSKLCLLTKWPVEPGRHDREDSLIVVPKAFALRFCEIEVKEVISFTSRQKLCLLLRTSVYQLLERESLKLSDGKGALIVERAGWDRRSHGERFDLIE